MKDWDTPNLHSLGLVLLGHCSQIDDQGACIIGDNLLILMNALDTPIHFEMPPEIKKLRTLERLIDTYDGDIDIVPFDTVKPYVLRGRSMALFRHQVGR